MQDERIKLPMIPLRGIVIFPGQNLHFDIGRDKSLFALNNAVENGMDIFLSSQKNPDMKDPGPSAISRMGVLAKILQVIKLPGDSIRVMVEGVARAEIVEYLPNNTFFEVSLKKSVTENADSVKSEALLRRCRETLGEYKKSESKMSGEIFETLVSETNPEKFANTIAPLIMSRENEKQAQLEENNLEIRLEKIYDRLLNEIEISQLEKKIHAKVRRSMDKSQRDYYLREQMKVISEELGDEEDIDELEKKMKECKMPAEVEAKVQKELKRLAKMAVSSPDATVSRTYIEWLCDMPWNNETTDNKDLSRAREILENDHYGLEKIKERILEYFAVKELTDKLNGPILCFVGPPGVGKTSIAKSIASCLGRKFVRMSLGGVRDEAEIRGHRRTYVGSIPGKIMYNIKQTGVKNPVFLLDEIDKMSSDYRGDPTSAMLEVLDPEQNGTFTDHYLEVPFDLSKTLFIATANSAERIPLPLLDRMEIIELDGYTYEEKIQIAKKFLLSKQEKMHGIPEGAIKISDEVFRDIITYYTRESGVRSLEREIAKICRKAAHKFVDDKTLKELVITAENLEGYLSVKKFREKLLQDGDIVGSATGLAWTEVGGTTLSIEVTLMKGKGEIQLTGHLGDVMKESARTAISLIRSMAKDFSIDPDIFKETDIHIHVPEGATPKDGPSAGITIATAILSALTEKPVSKDVAMTGEITLRGKVLPIGGVKEKSLAAHRAGIRTVIMPKDNEKDLAEIPKTIREEMNFVLTDNIRTVFDNSLLR